MFTCKTHRCRGPGDECPLCKSAAELQVAADAAASKRAAEETPSAQIVDLFAALKKALK